MQTHALPVQKKHIFRMQMHAFPVPVHAFAQQKTCSAAGVVSNAGYIGAYTTDHRKEL